jgi:hypothetical protein
MPISIYELMPQAKKNLSFAQPMWIYCRDGRNSLGIETILKFHRACDESFGILIYNYYMLKALKQELNFLEKEIKQGEFFCGIRNLLFFRNPVDFEDTIAGRKILYRLKEIINGFHRWHNCFRRIGITSEFMQPYLTFVL